MLGTMAFIHQHNPSALVVWCPGQFTDQMDAAMLTACAKYAHWLVVNEHEANHIRAHAAEVLSTKATIITRGAGAVEVLLSSGESKLYPVQEVSSVVDPTGSGDAFTAGVVSQLLRDTKQPLTHLDAAIESGIALARQCLTHHGAQPTLSSDSIVAAVNTFNAPDWLAAQPLVPLGHWPTPLEPLTRLSAELGGPKNLG